MANDKKGYGDEDKLKETRSEKEMLLEIIRLSSSDTITYDELSQILGAVERITSKSSKPGPDDLDQA